MPKWLLLLSLSVCACAPSLKDNPPREAQVPLPSTWPATDSGGSSAAQQTWREFFASAHLRALIGTALAQNREMNRQLQEIILAQNEAAARRGEVAPTLEADASAGVERVGEHTSQGRSDEAHGLPANLGDFSFGLRSSWEVDLWRRLRDARDAAGLRAHAAEQGRRFLQTQLVAEVARSYFELLAADNELALLDSNIELLTDAVAAVRLEKQAARVTELAVQRFEAELLHNQSRRYELQQQRTQTENRLNFLLGRLPQAILRDPQELHAPLPSGVQAGLPADLLDNRPDVQQAALELEAAKLDVRAAKAAFYPSLSLDASVGFRAFNPAHLLSVPGAVVYGLGAGLSAPLLNRAAISAAYRSANARQLQAVLCYEQALLRAFGEVYTQLSRLHNLQQTFDQQTQQAQTLARSVEVANVLFQSARADYLEVLLTRRESLEAQVRQIELKKQRWLAVVDLYQALGGGWRAER